MEEKSVKVLSKSAQSKINRKQKRCQSIVTNETGIPSSQSSTKFLAICNAGLSTGLREEDLLQSALNHGRVEEAIMIPNKSYCFLRCSDVESAERIFGAMHAQSKLAQNNGIIYLSYFENVPKIDNPWKSCRPPGLIVLENFVTQAEEILLLRAISDDCLENNESSLKHRTVKHFGYEFLYGSNQVDPNKPLNRKIPEACNFLWPRLSEKNPEILFEPDQLTMNQYKPGQGIPPHVDTHSAFLDPILSLSLDGDTVMDFKQNSRTISVLLPQRSLLIMSGESRYDWTHAIVPRHIDCLPSKSGGLTIQRRQKRTSLTFRKLRKAPCDCLYPTHCDSKMKKDINITTLTNCAEKLELDNVHIIYDKIASHFSETRHTPWPKVAEFINSFEIGSILIDIGCGNGKYLKLNENIAKIGCDRSGGLLKLCCSNNFNVFKCDCLNVPFRNNSINGCLSIAVIHHLATEERRLQAINEMARILAPGGRGLIYVWSKDQEADAKKSSYLRQNKAFHKVNKTSQKGLVQVKELQPNLPKPEVDLPIHMNRTQFQEQDIFVPWKLKSKCSSEVSGCTFLRYYHVFQENELDNLCKKVNGIEIVNSYYDQGNCLNLKAELLKTIANQSSSSINSDKARLPYSRAKQYFQIINHLTVLKKNCQKHQHPET